jgi:YVTN family beta-propeller protein
MSGTRQTWLHLVVVTLTLAGGCVPTDPNATHPDQVSQEIDAAGGSLTSKDGRLTLEVPPGALSGAETITITPLTPEQLASDWSGIPVADGYALGPDGLTFAVPVTVTIPLTQQPQWSEGSLEFAPEFLLLSSAGAVQGVDGVRLQAGPEGLLLKGQLAHFSSVAWYRSSRRVEYAARPIPEEIEIGKTFTVEVTVQGNVSEPAYRDRSAAPVLISGPPEAPLWQQTAFSYLLGVQYRCGDTPGTGILRLVIAARFYLVDWIDQEHKLWVEQMVRDGRLSPETEAESGVLEEDVVCIPLGPKSLTVRVEGDGKGVVTSTPPGIECPPECDEVFPGGTAVTLTATVLDGQTRFGGYHLDCPGQTAVVTLVMTDHWECEAAFYKVRYGAVDLRATTTGNALYDVFRAVVGEIEEDIGINGSLRLEPVPEGEQTASLEGVPPHCTVDQPTRTIQVEPGVATEVAWNVECDSPHTVTVTTITTGDGGPAEYELIRTMHPDHAEVTDRYVIGPNQTLVMDNLPTLYTAGLLLNGTDPCTVESENPQTMNPPLPDAVTFHVACPASSPPPVAQLLVSPNPTDPSVVDADGQGSVAAPGRAIVDFTWTWGDGASTVTTAPQASHSYPQDGTFTIELRVRDDTGREGPPVTHEVVISAPPNAAFSHEADGDNPLLVHLNASASTAGTPTGSVVSFRWDTDADDVFDDAEGVETEFQVEAAGTYRVALYVTDNRGSSDVTMLEVPVSAPASPLQLADIRVLAIRPDAGAVTPAGDLLFVAPREGTGAYELNIADPGNIRVAGYSTFYPCTGIGAATYAEYGTLTVWQAYGGTDRYGCIIQTHMGLDAATMSFQEGSVAGDATTVPGDPTRLLVALRGGLSLEGAWYDLVPLENGTCGGRYVEALNEEWALVVTAESQDNSCDAWRGLNRVYLGAGDPPGAATFGGGEPARAPTAEVVQRALFGTKPRDVVASPDGSTAYVADYAEHRVYVVAIATMQVTRTITVEGGPVALGLSPDGSYLFAATWDSHEVKMIDLTTDQVVATQGSRGMHPTRIFMLPGGALAVLNYGDTETATDGAVATFRYTPR